MFSFVVMPVQQKIHSLGVMLLDPEGASKTKSMRKQVFLKFFFSTFKV